MHALTLQAQSVLRARGAAAESLLQLLPGAWLAQSGAPRVPAPALYRPALGTVLQGAKQVLVGDAVLDYRAGDALLTRLPVPARGVVTRGNPQTPFVGLVIELDTAALRQLLAELRDQPRGDAAAPAPFSVVALQAPILGCLQRLLELAVDTSQAQQLLWPALQRELLFRLLQGAAAPALLAMAQPSPVARRMASAIRSVQRGFRQPLDTAALASRAGMGSTLFYRHFRAATGLSPLQYQKQLRLLEARRLLQRGGTGIAAAAFAVGYESPSQFSREFSRLFGHAPRDSLPPTAR
ncbi:AraC family transcriptional regulator [Stenotrophomonas sp. ZAC14D2_NAIMI4_7]|uniref:AraC family transcriptional regulator n=1 Tax=Stenotrophomonas sp. ZAC14D2_NAIMI4_7 TaxID=2072405 RepID=UPI00131F3023|nr:AraC family transcriptional regulator [Stenotrophomonas sp. ZAC14D2_NAIMI4_7]